METPLEIQQQAEVRNKDYKTGISLLPQSSLTTKLCSAGIYGQGWSYPAGHTGVVVGVRGQRLALNSCPESKQR